MNEAETDARLRALFAPPEELPDEIFTARVRRAVIAEARLRAARRRLWRHFVVEAAGSAAVIWAFLQLGSAESPSDTIDFSPAVAGLMLVGLWVLATFRPGVAR